MKQREFPNYFADADQTFQTAKYIIFGIPYEHISSFRHGADKAPHQIRQASWNFETYDFRTNINLQNISLHDFGDLPTQHTSANTLNKEITRFTQNIIKKNKFPLALGGDHAITSGIIAALPTNTYILSLDAHLDYRMEYENNPFNHACALRRITDHIPSNQIIAFGIRSADQQEYYDAQHNDITIIDSYTIQKQGIKPTLHTLNEFIKNNPLYITLDIDVIDPAFAPATSTPEPFGLHPNELLQTIEMLAPHTIGMDLVEVCPGFDHGETALLAAKLIRLFLAFHWKSTKP